MEIDKKTKIVCTIGPATESVEKLTDLVMAGMNVMRLNFSHGDFEEHQVRIDNICQVIKKTGKKAQTFEDYEAIAEYLADTTGTGDLIITMGAGAINKVAEMLVGKT